MLLIWLIIACLIHYLRGWLSRSSWNNRVVACIYFQVVHCVLVIIFSLISIITGINSHDLLVFREIIIIDLIGILINLGWTGFVVSIDPELRQDADVSADLEESATYQCKGTVVRGIVGEFVKITSKPNQNEYHCKALGILSLVV